MSNVCSRWSYISPAHDAYIEPAPRLDLAVEVNDLYHFTQKFGAMK